MCPQEKEYLFKWLLFFYNNLLTIVKHKILIRSIIFHIYEISINIYSVKNRFEEKKRERILTNKFKDCSLKKIWCFTNLGWTHLWVCFSSYGICTYCMGKTLPYMIVAAEVFCLMWDRWCRKITIYWLSFIEDIFCINGKCKSYWILKLWTKQSI
jgi:hypothetical protein